MAFTGAATAINIADDLTYDITSEQIEKATEFLTEICINDNVSAHQEEYDIFEEYSLLYYGRSVADMCDDFIEELEDGYDNDL